MANKAKDMEGYVGFANLPNQVYRRSVKRGFEFTLMVVGESGLGKSTLINSLFLTDIYSSVYPGPSQRIKKTVKVETSNVHLKENGVNLRLTIVDTPGFGDQVDNSNCWQPILEHIDSKFEEYLNAESRVNRCSLPDKRVHCCLYFIAPSGHGLKPLDVELMKRLHDKVNIIPLIAKADTLTPDECKEFKKRIMKEIKEHEINIYQFPDIEDEEENSASKKLAVSKIKGKKDTVGILSIDVAGILSSYVSLDKAGARKVLSPSDAVGVLSVESVRRSWSTLSVESVRHSWST